MRNFVRVLVVAIVALLPLCAPPAAAAVRFNVDVLWNPNPDDSAQVYLHATNEVFPMPRERVSAVFHQIDNPYDDYPVLAFVAYNAHVDIATVWQYKRKGHVWSNVMWHFGVPPSALFVDLPRSPNPPFGNAYGHWKKQGDRMPRDVISNDDIHYWVGLRTVAGYGRVDPRQVCEWRNSGQRYDAMTIREYRVKHAKGPGPGPGQNGQGGQGGQGQQGGPGRGWAKGHGKDNSHDHDRD